MRLNTAQIVDEPLFRNRKYVFKDRFHAGELLAKRLEEYKEKKDVYMFAIPAGGVQVAIIIAERLRIRIDLAITRKLHVPWNREAGFGAISWDGTMFLNQPFITSLGLTRDNVNHCVVEEKKIIRNRLKKFRGDKPFPDLKQKIVIIIDDGLASGFSMLTTLKTMESMGVKERIVAVPTAPISAINLIRTYADKIVCLNIRAEHVFAVADAYKEWYDLADENVIDVLKLSSTYQR